MENNELDFSGFDPGEGEEIPIVEDNVDGNELNPGDEGYVAPEPEIPEEDEDENPPAIEDEGDGDPPPEPEEEEEDEGDDDKTISLVYSNIAKLLNEEGLITSEDINLDEIGTPDALADAIKGEIKRNEFADLSQTQRDYLDAIRNGVPDDIFLKHQQTIQTYKDIDEISLAADPELVKSIILGDLKTKGISDTRANKLYQSMVEDGEALDEAITSLSVLQAKEQDAYQAQLDAIQAENEKIEKQNIADAKALKDSVYNVKEIIKDMKITDSLRDKVYDSMTKPVAYSEDGQAVNKFTNTREKNPVEFDTKVYYLFELTKGFTDFSIFEKKAQSKAARQLEQVVSKSNILNIGSKPNVKHITEEEDIPVITELSNDY